MSVILSAAKDLIRLEQHSFDRDKVLRCAQDDNRLNYYPTQDASAALSMRAYVR